MNIINELKQRRLVQILVSYLAAGFIGLEVFGHFVERGVVPDIVYEVALEWYVVGILAALVIGWYHGEKGEQGVPMSERVMLAGLGLVALSVSGASVAGYVADLNRRLAAAESELELSRIAVTYFEDQSPDGELQFLAEGLTEGLIDELGAVRSLDVISRNGVAPFRDSELPADSVARILGAGTLVDGSVEREGERVRVDLRLVDGQSGAVMERASFQHPAEDLFAIREQISREAAILLRGWLGEEVQLRRTERATEDVRAWAMYQRAEKARKDAVAAVQRDDLEAARALFHDADALADQASMLDPNWTAPPVLRATLEYRLSRLARDREELVRHVEKGLGHVQSALATDAGDAEGLAVRGTLRYWRHLQRLDPDPAVQAELLADAQADLERAVALDPTLAEAHQVLSHLYYRDNRAQAVLAARTAYQEDAYLEVADEVLSRLFNGNYDLEQFTQARRWCEEGHRRFPGDERFTECQLLLMTTAEVEADPERAHRLAAALDTLLPHHDDLRRGYAWLMVGGVLARAGMRDSADVVMRGVRDRVTPEEDPNRELLQFEAAMRTLMGDEEEAVGLLQRYAAVNPHASFEHHWWWRDLRGHPGLPRATGQQGH